VQTIVSLPVPDHRKVKMKYNTEYRSETNMSTKDEA